MRLLLSVAVVLASSAFVGAQQIADTTFHPLIERPAYPNRIGPVVLFDEGHFNFHTSTGRYLAFARLLDRDGYRVEPLKELFSAQALRAGTVLVIANALNGENERNEWKPPHLPAFNPPEVVAVHGWVSGGGALLLITDHSPFDAAVSDLAKAFGVQLLDRATLGTDAGRTRVFQKSDGSLAAHPLTRGIDQVATFGGSWFDAGSSGQPLLFLQAGRPRAVQGAVMLYGKGKLAIFGEAAMFSAQLAGPAKVAMGMNAPIAKQNSQFLLNVMHWLSGI